MSFALLDQNTPAIAWETPARRDKPKKRRLGKNSAKPPKGKTADAAGKNSFKIQMENLMEIFMVTVFCFAVFQGYLFLTQSPRLQVSTVSINGNHRLSQEKLINMIGPAKGKNIFTLNLPGIAEKLSGHPWIRSVSVERQLPDNIHLYIEERKPYARVQLDDTHLMDNYAVLMGPAGPEYNELPLITGVERETVGPGQSVATENLMAGLKIMHYLNRLDFFRNDPIDALKLHDTSPSVLITRNRGIKIFVNLDTLEESFADFKLLLDLIEPEQTSFQYIDLSFKDKVVVKPAKTKINRDSQSRSYY